MKLSYAPYPGQILNVGKTVMIVDKTAMNDALDEHIKKLYLEEGDIIIVDNVELLHSFEHIKSDRKNYIIYAPDCDITKCKIEDLRAVVEAYDRERK